MEVPMRPDLFRWAKCQLASLAADVTRWNLLPSGGKQVVATCLQDMQKNGKAIRLSQTMLKFVSPSSWVLLFLFKFSLKFCQIIFHFLAASFINKSLQGCQHHHSHWPTPCRSQAMQQAAVGDEIWHLVLRENIYAANQEAGKATKLGGFLLKVMGTWDHSSVSSKTFALKNHWSTNSSQNPHSNHPHLISPQC